MTFGDLISEALGTTSDAFDGFLDIIDRVTGIDTAKAIRVRVRALLSAADLKVLQTVWDRLGDDDNREAVLIFGDEDTARKFKVNMDTLNTITDQIWGELES